MPSTTLLSVLKSTGAVFIYQDLILGYLNQPF